jgi:hypothetical protein
MGSHRKLGIYVGYETPSIVKYLEPKPGDLFTARYDDSIFDEEHFLALGGGLYLNNKQCREIEWSSSSIQSLDPHTKDTELEVQRIIILQQLPNNLPDAFTDIRGVSKSHIPAANAPERVEIPLEGMNSYQVPNPRKMGRGKLDDSVRAKRGSPQRQVARENALHPHSVVPPETHLEGESPSATVRTNSYNSTRTTEQLSSSNLGNNDEPDDSVEEISINYAESGELYNRKTTDVDINFVSKIADAIEDPEPKSMAECRKHSDRVKWKEAIETELCSLSKRQVFGPVARTPPNIFPVGCKWVFVRKRDENNVMVRYKARLVAQGFTQSPSSITMKHILQL